MNGVPLCDGQNGRPAHDPTKWHPLTVNNPNGSVLCTYGHEHGIDPHQLDSVFGPLPLAQDISYPWATVSATGVQENSTYAKHSVYKWIAAPALQCSLNGAPDGSSKMVTAFREELHADGSMGAAIRFHSFWGQYKLTDCATGSQGTLQVGGHMDYAALHGVAGAIVPQPAIDPPATCVTNGDGRQEGVLGGPEQPDSVWYGSNGRGPGCDDNNQTGPHVNVQVNVGRNNFGPVDSSNPSAMLFYPNLDRHDGVGIRTDALTRGVYGFSTDATGHVNFTGHVNRHGLVVPEVAGQSEGIDYILVVIQNAEPKAYGANGAAPCVGRLQHCPVAYNGDVAGPNGQLGYYVELP